MSIYPKKILINEKVNLHVRIINKSDKFVKNKGEYFVYIFSPSNFLIKKINKKFVLNKLIDMQITFCPATPEIGKYKVITFIKIGDKMYLSDTYNKDYFIVAKFL